MKLLRILEIVGVPLALAYEGWQAVPWTMQLVALQERAYTSVSVADPFKPILMVTFSGLLAGLAAVIVQWKNLPKRRWWFYVQVASTLLVTAALVFVIEDLRPRGDVISAKLGFAHQNLVSSVPFWILSAGFAVPFVVLAWTKLRRPPVPAE